MSPAKTRTRLKKCGIKVSNKLKKNSKIKITKQCIRLYKYGKITTV